MNYSNDYDLARVLKDAANGYIVINYKIRGFWSSDPLKIYIKRSGLNSASEWTIDISWSSGGRDVKEVADDVVAAENFANALQHAVACARDIRNVLLNDFEAAYQAGLERFRKEAEEERLAREQAREADPPLTEDSYNRILDLAHKGVSIVVKKRGEHHRSIVVDALPGRKRRLNGRVVSLKALRETILESGDYSNKFDLWNVQDAVGA